MRVAHDQVIEADCVEAMRAMPEASVDAIVTDPPYGLEFMGKEWDRLDGGLPQENVWKGRRGGGGSNIGDDDSKPASRHHVALGAGKQHGFPRCQKCGKRQFSGSPCECPDPDFVLEYRQEAPSSSLRMQRWHEEWARAAYRVLKPGGHLLAFGGTRTYHRLACAIEDAGFEIRDSIANVSTPKPPHVDLLREWIRWTERAPHAGLRLLGQGEDSVPAPVLLSTNLDVSPANALIAELRSSEAHRTDVDAWRSAVSTVDVPSTGSSALVTIAGNRPASPDATCTPGSTAHNDALGWLDASTEATTRAVEALRIWRGSAPSSRPAATDALCAALTDALKAITCAQSKTFQTYDTTSRTVCVSAMTATTTASTAAHLLAFTADTLARQGGDALEASPSGPLLWIYGSGFPPSKSLDVSKAIDRTNGKPLDRLRDFGAEARQWEGWGTALKPAHEPIVCARKPLAGTVAETVLGFGTGALNIDATRIGFRGEEDESESKGKNRHEDFGTAAGGNAVYGDYSMVERRNYNPPGRWPANVALDEDAARLLDAQTGELTSGGLLPGHRQGQGTHTHEGGYVGGGVIERAYGGDSGGASRFFYVAKASAAERSAGLDNFEGVAERNYEGGDLNRPDRIGSDGVQRTGNRSPRANSHPTVKPIALMRWLVRLVTPPGGTVLDCFCGSGTTGCAAALEGFGFIGIEREAEYAAIARARIAWWAGHPEGMELVKRLEADRERRETVERGQLGFFEEAA